MASKDSVILLTTDEGAAKGESKAGSMRGSALSSGAPESSTRTAKEGMLWTAVFLGLCDSEGCWTEIQRAT